jgi:DNA repair protein RecO (recombination protein O)
MATSTISTPAIVLRRVNYGDYDLIITLLTLSEGRLSVMAKSAKKSVKRFGGALELFSLLNITCTTGPKQRLPLLQEASLTHPFPKIRSDMLKTAYASYWSEIVLKWIMEGKKEDRIYHLLQGVLEELDDGGLSPALLSLVFQVRFLTLSGLRPEMEQCMGCKKEIALVTAPILMFDPHRSGLFCRQCAGHGREALSLSKGTLKLLSWIEQEGIDHVRRIRFSPRSLFEGQRFLETLIPYHLGKMPNSLLFLQKIRPAPGSEPWNRGEL